MPINKKLHNVLYIVGLVILHVMELWSSYCIPWEWMLLHVRDSDRLARATELNSVAGIASSHKTNQGNLQSFPKQFGPNRAATIKTRFEGK